MNAAHGRWCAALLLALLVGPAGAGPWEARSGQGLVVRIEQDVYRTRDGYVLSRRYPDGTADQQFGEQGSTVFSLGPDNEGPAALRMDEQGRLWVAGASLGATEQIQAVVLRFTALGKPDRAYAQSGRSAVQPAGRPARALDLLPMPDGSCYVAGLVTDSNGQERSGWWRLLPDGSVDPQFGLGGLWADSGRDSTEVLELSMAANGAVTLRLRRGQAHDAPVEAWTLAPGARVPALAGTPTAAGAVAVKPPGLAAATEPASFKQGGVPPDPAATASAPSPLRPLRGITSESALLGGVGLGLAVGLLGWFWRRRR